MKLLIKPRLYQEKIFANSIKENTLITIPTGLGKTIIALMITLHKLNKGKVMILAPTKPLVEQHYKTFINKSDLTEEECTIITGKINPEKRKKEYNKKVIFATPQTIRNDMIRRWININEYETIIFDECHKAIGDYAYTFIAKNYNNHIIGLSASPGSNEEQIRQICNNLKITRIESRTEEDEDVKKYVNKKQIINIRVELPDDFKQIINHLRKTLSKSLKELKKEGIIITSNQKKIRKTELLLMQKQAIKKQEYKTNSLIARTIKVMHALELIQTQGIKPLKDYFTTLKKQSSKATTTLLRDEEFRKAMKITYESNEEHPKIKEIIKLIKPNESNLIFTQYRTTAQLITDKINKEIGGARLFVGQKGMSQKEQASILNSFRNKEFNTLVSTSISEEGLDIPVIDNAIFYEPVPSALRTIQRKGRVGRAKTGRVYVLITNGTVDESYYWVAKNKEKKLIRTIKNIDLKQSKLNYFI